jgi:hypothetical protein
MKTILSVGNPVSLSNGHVIRGENDFSVTVKHGLSLDLSRLYSSTPNYGFGYRNHSNLGMFGQNWYSPHEQHLQGIIYLDGEEDLLWFSFVDENGSRRHFEQVEANFWRSRLDQGSPLELTRTGTGTSTVFTQRSAENSVRKFRHDGRIIESLIPAHS